MLTVAIFVIAVVVLGLLAQRFATDSRAGAWSSEQEYAQLGLECGDSLDRPNRDIARSFDGGAQVRKVGAHARWRSPRLPGSESRWVLHPSPHAEAYTYQTREED